MATYRRLSPKQPAFSQRGFTLVELMCVVAIVALLSSIALPAFSKYIRQAKTVEAGGILRKIYDAEVSHFYRIQSFKTNRSGVEVFSWGATSCGDFTNGPLCYAFTYSAAYDPALGVGLGPRGRKVLLAYDPPPGGTYDKNPNDWYKSLPTIGVTLDSPSYFAYTVNPGAVDVMSLCKNPGRFVYQSFRAEAYGDLDGDTVNSTFLRMGYIDTRGEVTGTPGLYSYEPLE